MAIYSVWHEFRNIILQDMLLLLKNNDFNCKKIVNYIEFFYWLLDILLEQFLKLK